MENNIYNLAYEKLKFNENLIPISNNEDEKKLKKFTREEIFDPNYTLFKMAVRETDFKLAYRLVSSLERQVYEHFDVELDIKPVLNIAHPIPEKLRNFNG